MENKMRETTKEKTLNELWSERGYKIAKGMNLVIAPCGSGKTYFVFNTLIKGVPLEDILYLCDTRNLKNAVALDKEYHDLCRFYCKGESNNIIKGSQFNGIGERLFYENKITVMTYAQFGLLAKNNPCAFGDVKMIICDEAHQAIDYNRKFDNEESNTYGVAVNTINELYKKAKVILLTATPEIIDRRRIPIQFDFRNEPNIKRLKEKNVILFNSNMDIENVIAELKKITEKKSIKMLVYTDRIKTVKEIVTSCYENGLKAVGLWSLNNKDNAMSTYQLECLESVVRDSLIPKDLDILVINASLQTGVNIKNNDIDWVLVNSTNKITQIQARSRARKDIDRLYIKSNKVASVKEISLDKKWLGKPLTTKDKQALCNELNRFNERGRLKRWNTIAKELIDQGYKINPKKITIDDKRQSCHIINK